MSIRIMSFTRNGMARSRELAALFDRNEVEVFTRCSSAREEGEACGIRFAEQSLGDWTRAQMEEKHTILFIGACGIAVRAIAPGVNDKLTDSAVLVMDERGEYIIPLLSGHVGGANELAVQIAAGIGAVPVITTATDLNDRFAVDLFAKRNHLHIEEKSGIAKVSSRVLNGEQLRLYLEEEHLEEGTEIPTVFLPVDEAKQADVVISSDRSEQAKLLTLRPKEYVIGVGCKKGKEEEKLQGFLRKILEENGIGLEQVYAVASVDRKKDEEGLVSWCRKNRIPFLTFSAEELCQVEGDFSASAFVQAQVGVDNVCERAARKACGKEGRLIRRKYAEDGMTAAIARREWRVRFDEQ